MGKDVKNKLTIVNGDEKKKENKTVTSEDRKKSLLTKPIKTLKHVNTSNNIDNAKSNKSKKEISKEEKKEEIKEEVDLEKGREKQKEDVKDDEKEKPAKKTVLNKDGKDSSVLNNQTLGTIVLTETNLVEANLIELNAEDIIGYASYLNPHVELDLTMQGLYFIKTSEIPCLYAQTKFEISDIVTASQLHEGIRPQLSEKSEIYKVSDEMYNTTTSLILIEFRPDKFPEPVADDVSKFNQGLNPFKSLIVSGTHPQQSYQHKALGNFLNKLATLLRSSDFILADLETEIQTTRLNSAPYGNLLEGKEIITKGEPHLAYISSIFNNEHIESAIYRALTNNGALAVRTGRVNGSQVYVNSMPIHYQAYVHTDQFTALLNNLNIDWILRHRLNYQLFAKELIAFSTTNTILEQKTLQIFFDNMCYRTRFTKQEHENVLLAYHLFPAASVYIVDQLTEIIERLNLLRSESCVEWLVQNQAGKQDISITMGTLAHLKQAPQENVISLIMMEGLRYVSDISISVSSPAVGINVINQLYDIFICALFFPYIFSKLIPDYFPILYTILNNTIPDIMNAFVAEFNFYSIKDREGRWVPYHTEVYSRICFDNGVMPSLLVREPRHPLLRKIKEALKPKFYPQKLENRRRAGYPFITGNYIYQSSWPVTDINGGVSESAYMLRIQSTMQVVTDILAKLLQKEGGLIFRKVTMTNQSTIQSITSFAHSLLPLIKEAGLTLIRIASPIITRLHYCPLLPGSIVDLMHSTDQFDPTYPTANNIGVYARKINSSRRREETTVGYAPKSLTILLKGLQFLNFATSLTTPNGRGVYTGVCANKNPQSFEIKQIDPMELYKLYDGICGQVRIWMNQLFTYLSTIDPDLFEEFYQVIQEMLPTSNKARVSKELLVFMEKNCYLTISSVFEIFKNIVGEKVLADPRGYNFTLGVIAPDLRVVLQQVDGTYIGHKFELAGKLYKDKMLLLSHVLTADNLPNLRMGTGLALGSFTTPRPHYRDIAPSPVHENVWIHNQTFTYNQVENPNVPGNYVTKLVYHYWIDGEEHLAYQPLEINNYHTLIMDYITEVQTQAQKEFLLTALRVGRISIYLRKIKYLWNLCLPKTMQSNTTYGESTITSIFDMGTTAEEYPEVTLIEGSQLFQSSPYQIQGGIIRCVLPIETPIKLILASGLYDNTITRPPYINEKFFKFSNPGESDDAAMRRKLTDSPNINNKVTVLTSLAQFDLPEVSFIYSQELM